ncbi:Golgin subfamily A member 7/ERF4 family-domain-containing protein [Melampsora americana]|nr:Golgin subfamily A member 7/ERF4 family-domain-containing protein [Melampsora americana]
MLITHPYPTHSTHPSNQPNPHPPVTPSTQTEPQTQVTIPKEDLIEEENPRGEGEEEEGMEGEEGSSSEDRIEIFGSSPVGIIGKTKPRAVVRIERDYSAKGATSGRVQFWDGWVTELEGRITPLQLQNTLNDLNGILASAYDPYKSILDNTLSVLTLYLSPLFFTSHYQKEMIGFSHALELANQKIFNPVGLNLLHPRKVAFLFVSQSFFSSSLHFLSFFSLG